MVLITTLMSGNNIAYSSGLLPELSRSIIKIVENTK
jgi:hypothetical protein